MVLLKYLVACKVLPYRLVFTEVSKNLQGTAVQAEEFLEPFATLSSNMKHRFVARIIVLDFVLPLLSFRSTFLLTYIHTYIPTHILTYLPSIQLFISTLLGRIIGNMF